ncbi:MAG: outer membrane beta-barrel protein [Chitinophagaceae bacterium]|nr:outer membrane beta-barrel protein [Chitinophagaceae bacterium]
MGKDVHNMDDLFNSAYREFDEVPSADVWKKLNAGLDKQEAASYKKRSAGWKRIAILLLLLLSGLVIYESGLFNKKPSNNDKNLAIKKSGTSPTLTTKGDSGNPKNNPAAGKNEDNRQDKKTVNPEKDDINPAPEQRVNTLVTPKISVSAAEKAKRAIAKSRLPITNQKNKEAGKSIQADDMARSNNIIAENEISAKTKNRLATVDKIAKPDINAPYHMGEKSVLPSLSDWLITEKTSGRKKAIKTDQFKPYWSGTVIVSYEHADYRLDSDLPVKTDIKQREVHEPSVSTGVLLMRQFKKQWGVQTGLIFTSTAIAITPQKLYAFQDPNGNIAYKYVTSSGYTYIKPGFGPPPAFGDSMTATEAKHTLQSISIPLVIKYTAGKNKFSFTPGAGIEFNFLTAAKLETEIENSSGKEVVFINKLSGTRSFYWSATADAELRYHANKKLSLNLRPVFRYALSPVTNKNEVETFPYSFGLGLGITYKFR